jgi:hypothetical protein
MNTNRIMPSEPVALQVILPIELPTLSFRYKNNFRVLQRLFTILEETRRDEISKNSSDWLSKRQCQTTKSLQFLREVEKR